MTNPLCGPTGASAVYGPQKGATPAMVETLDRNLAHFAAIVERDLGVAIKDLPGSGAAGGLGGGLVAFAAGKLDAGYRPGHRGGQSRVAARARRPVPDRRRGDRRPERLRQDGRRRRPAGSLAALPDPGPGRHDRPGRRAVLDQGIDAYFSICPGPIELDEAIEPGRRAARARDRAGRPGVPGGRCECDMIPDEANSAMPESEPTSEFALIDWIRQRERARAVRSPWTKLGIGDDCAILDVGPRVDLLVTTDMLMDGRHFRLEEDGPERVGYKALGVNLSDIAAMAGVPRAALVAVALPHSRRSRAGTGNPRRDGAAGRAVSASTWSAAIPTPGTARS